MLLRWSVSGHCDGAGDGDKVGRTNGAFGDGNNLCGNAQWSVQKNASRASPTLRPPVGTLNQPCFTGVEPVMVAGKKTGFGLAVWLIVSPKQSLPFGATVRSLTPTASFGPNSPSNPLGLDGRASPKSKINLPRFSTG